jgi:hypothetical protein
MLSVATKSIMLSVIMLNVTMLNVMAPISTLSANENVVLQFIMPLNSVYKKKIVLINVYRKIGKLLPR